MELPDLIQCSGLQHSLASGVHSTTMPWFDSYFNLKHLWCLFQPCLDSHRVTEMSQHLVPLEEPWDEHMQNAPQIYAHRHAWAQPWWLTHRPPRWHPYNIRQGRGLLGHLTPLRKTLSSRKLKDILIHHESSKTCGRADPCWVFTSHPQPPSPLSLTRITPTLQLLLILPAPVSTCPIHLQQSHSSPQAQRRGCFDSWDCTTVVLSSNAWE